MSASAVLLTPQRTPSPALRRFAWAVLAYFIAVILWGSLVRATGSGAGCGNHWPLCNGTVMQHSPHLDTIIEFTHRITSGISTFAAIGLLVWTFLGTARTPNGRTQGWDRKVYARMSNTFFARGNREPAEMLDSLKQGLYLQGFRNGIEDPQGWGIQFTAGTAREVKNGKFTGRVFAPPTITGYVPEILGNITMIGNDFALEPGSCGKGFKEFVPVTSGGPHIRTRAKVS